MNDRVIEGRQAAGELRLVGPTLDAIEKETVAAWVACRDTADREKLHAMMCAVDMLRKRLLGIEASGKIEERLSEETA